MWRGQLATFHLCDMTASVKYNEASWTAFMRTI
jgi:hypothetical protein